MAFTITLTPRKVSLNKNPIILKVNSDNIYDVIPVKSKLTLVFNTDNFPGNNTVISILHLGVNAGRQFRFRNFGDVTGAYDIFRNNNGTYTSSTYLNWIYECVIPVLQKDYHLRNFFNISAEVTGANECKIYFEALSADPLYDIALVSTTVASNCLTASVSVPGVKGVRIANYKFFCDVYTSLDYEQFPFVKVAELESDVDDEGNGYFNLERVLVHEEVSLPNLITKFDRSYCIKQYQAFAGEKIGNPPVYFSGNGIGTPLDPLYFITGALQDDKWPIKNFFDNVIDEVPQRFLSLHPRKLTISRKQRVLLYHFFTHSSGGTRLRCKLYNTNGGNSTVTLTQTSSNLLNKLYSYAVGVPNYTEISSYENLYKYEVWLEKDNGDVLSEKMTYIISEFEYEHNRYFIYRNSFGTFETIWCHGAAEVSHEHSYETAMVHIPGTANTLRPNFKQYGKNFETKIKLTTGIQGREDDFDGKEYTQYLLDFFNSDMVFELIDEQVGEGIVTRALPVLLNVKENIQIADMDTIFNTPFEYQYAYKHKGFTPSWL